MTTQDGEFLQQLRAAFHVEAEEHLQAISSGLLQLEKSQDADSRREIIATVFREAHSLKGAAMAVNLDDVEAVCQSLEGVFAAWRRHDVAPLPELLDPLHAAVRAMESLLPDPDGERPEPAPVKTAEDQGRMVGALLQKLTGLEARWGRAETANQSADLIYKPIVVPHVATADSEPSASVVSSASTPAAPIEPTDSPAPAAPLEPLASPDTPAHPQAAAPAKHTPSDTLRVATAKLDALRLQAEEMLAVKLTAAQRAADVRSIVDLLDARDKEWSRFLSDFGSAKVPARAPGPALGSSPPDAAFKAFLEWNQEHARVLREQLLALTKAVSHDRRTTAGMVDALLRSSKKLLMLPAATLLDMCPRLVRELSRELGKDIDLTVHGGEIEVDKRILEEMKDPLIHLLRNAIDHGIELAEKRAQQGKPARGTIAVTIGRIEATKVEIVVRDDGAGIDVAQVRSAAVRRGVITQEEAECLGESESLVLVFRPDVSTSPIVTEISGRGLGMDIVKSKVERLGGRVDIDARIGAGTAFRLLLPLTLATFRGILIRSADQTFVVPTTRVDRVVRVRPEDIRTVEGCETLKLNGNAVSFVRLSDVLELPDAATEVGGRRWAPVIVMSSGGQRIAFQVDAVVNEQEILLKPLGMPLTRVRNISAATVLGTGKAVPILNVDDLMKSAARARPGPPRLSAVAAARRAKIIVADDSITSRMFIKNILESGGHHVMTAVDGLEAMTALKRESFDLVVSDVEMSRMDGFELTAQIRADANLAKLPVILVTALASREHREHGVDVGADAYIVKSSFDQSDLLDAVRRLL